MRSARIPERAHCCLIPSKTTGGPEIPLAPPISPLTRPAPHAATRRRRQGRPGRTASVTAAAMLRAPMTSRIVPASARARTYTPSGTAGRAQAYSKPILESDMSLNVLTASRTASGNQLNTTTGTATAGGNIKSMRGEAMTAKPKPVIDDTSAADPRMRLAHSIAGVSITGSWASSSSGHLAGRLRPRHRLEQRRMNLAGLPYERC